MADLRSLSGSTSDDWFDDEVEETPVAAMAPVTPVSSKRRGPRVERAVRPVAAAEPVEPEPMPEPEAPAAEQPSSGMLSRLPGRGAGKKRAPKAAAPAGADAWNRPKPLWFITLVAIVICLALSLIIGFATKGATSGGDQQATDQTQQVASAVDLSGGATSSTVLTAMQSGQLTWNGNPLAYTSPSATVVAGEVTASASFVDCNTAIEQAVALATACFADPQVTKLTYSALSAEGTAEVKIEIEASQTPVATLADMQKGSPEQTYGKVAAYTISENAFAASGYHAIEATGGTGLTPAPTAEGATATEGEGTAEGEGESTESESTGEEDIEY